MRYKKCTPKQKELLNLFNDLLDTILTDKTLMSSKDENENENENDKTLIHQMMMMMMMIMKMKMNMNMTKH